METRFENRTDPLPTWPTIEPTLWLTVAFAGASLAVAAIVQAFGGDLRAPSAIAWTLAGIALAAIALGRSHTLIERASGEAPRVEPAPLAQPRSA